MRVAKQLTSIQRHIDALRASGWDVHMRHEDSDYVMSHPDEDGDVEYGTTKMTTLQIISPESWGSAVFFGTATCSPHDHFNRVTGTRIAWQRAVKEMTRALGRPLVKDIFEGLV